MVLGGRTGAALMGSPAESIRAVWRRWPPSPLQRDQPETRTCWSSRRCEAAIVAVRCSIRRLPDGSRVTPCPQTMAAPAHNSASFAPTQPATPGPGGGPFDGPAPGHHGVPTSGGSHAEAKHCCASYRGTFGADERDGARRGASRSPVGLHHGRVQSAGEADVALIVGVPMVSVWIRWKLFGSTTQLIVAEPRRTRTPRPVAAGLYGDHGRHPFGAGRIWRHRPPGLDRGFATAETAA